MGNGRIDDDPSIRKRESDIMERGFEHRPERAFEHRVHLGPEHLGRPAQICGIREITNPVEITVAKSDVEISNFVAAKETEIADSVEVAVERAGIQVAVEVAVIASNIGDAVEVTIECAGIVVAIAVATEGTFVKQPVEIAVEVAGIEIPVGDSNVSGAAELSGISDPVQNSYIEIAGGLVLAVDTVGKAPVSNALVSAADIVVTGVEKTFVPISSIGDAVIVLPHISIAEISIFIGNPIAMCVNAPLKQPMRQGCRCGGARDDHDGGCCGEACAGHCAKKTLVHGFLLQGEGSEGRSRRLARGASGQRSRDREPICRPACVPARKAASTRLVAPVLRMMFLRWTFTVEIEIPSS